MDCDAANEAKELVRHHLAEYIHCCDIHSSDANREAAVMTFAETLLKALDDSTAD